MNNDNRFLVVGESVVDLLTGPDAPITAAPGGSPANVAVALGRLGDNVEFVTELGDDAGGALLRGHLVTSGVTLRAEPILRTPRALTRRGIDGAATYDFTLGWTLRGPIPAPAGGVVHVGSLGAVLRPGADAVLDLLERAGSGVAISFDPNCRPSLMGEAAATRPLVEALVRRADLVKVSAEDLDWLYPGEGYERAARRWSISGPALVVVTRGAEGSMAMAEGGTLERPAVAVELVDTIGAGDAFTAGLLHRLSRDSPLTPPGLRGLHLDELADALSFAAEVAAVTCSRAGADPPWRTELPSPTGPREPSVPTVNSGCGPDGAADRGESGV